MGSSQRTMFARHRNIHGGLYVALLVLTVLNRGILVQTSIVSVQSDLTVRVGEDVSIYFMYCARNKPDCDPMSFNFSSPNPACTLDRYEHCQLKRVSEENPLREILESDCELCKIVVHGVSQTDAGLYSICEVPAPCTKEFGRNLGRIEIENEEQSTVNPPGIVIENTTHGSSPATTTTSPPTNPSEQKFTTDTIKPSYTASRIGAPRPVPSSAIGVPVTISIIIIVIIAGVLYFYKKRNGWRRNGHTSEALEEKNDTNGNAKTTVNVDVYIEIPNEDPSLGADPE